MMVWFLEPASDCTWLLREPVRPVMAPLMNTDDAQDKDLHFRFGHGWPTTKGKHDRGLHRGMGCGLIYINIGPGAHTPLVPSPSFCACARELMIGKRFDSLLQPPLPSTLLAPEKNSASLMFFWFLFPYEVTAHACAGRVGKVESGFKVSKC